MGIYETIREKCEAQLEREFRATEPEIPTKLWRTREAQWEYEFANNDLERALASGETDFPPQAKLEQNAMRGALVEALRARGWSSGDLKAHYGHVWTRSWCRAAIGSYALREWRERWVEIRQGHIQAAEGRLAAAQQRLIEARQLPDDDPDRVEQYITWERTYENEHSNLLVDRDRD